ncbi:protein mono-ADP-ribosyltransferase PARP4 [Marmota marmota marmota]|uniref:protein mono-ADP-ribosyltransferase PARP4 n=1 Tax=Marmota marmota marmota TaxID=9994 RepID=UPI0020922296|nr:protein mono-ADP-ribosyltransferase PARP4 [Marmota marmota marmota]
MTVGIFVNCTFCLKVKYLPHQQKKKLQTDIKENGGKFSLLLNPQCTHIILDNADVLSQYQLNAIRKNHVHITSPDFIWDSIKERRLLDVKNYDPSKSCDIKPSPEEKASSSEVKTDDLSLDNSSEKKNVEDTEFYEENDEIPYFPQDFEVAKYNTLEKVGVDGGQETAVVELQCTLEPGDCPFLVSAHFLLADGGQTRRHYKDTIKKTSADASEYYENYIEELKNQGFLLREHFTPEATQLASEKLQALLLEEVISSSTLSQEVSDLVEMIWAEALGHLEHTLLKPVNRISLNDVSKAEGILLLVKTALKNGETAEQLQKMMTEFYRLIPHRHPVTEEVNLRLLTKKEDLCQLIRDMVNVCETHLSKPNPPCLAKYRALRCKIEYIEPNTEEFSWVRKEILQNNHSKSSVDILQIFRVGRVNEATEFLSKLGNVRSLLHGSPVQNIVGILSRGLLLPKVVEDHGVQRTDIGNLGSGIYFSDSLSTSIKYSHPGEIDGSRLLVICDVALGKCMDLLKKDFSLTEAPPGYDSVHGVSDTASIPTDFKDDEFVIYKTNQVRMKYIVKFCMPGDQIKDFHPCQNTELEDYRPKFLNFSKVEDYQLPDTKPSSNVKAGLQDISGNLIPLEDVHIKGRIMDFVAQVIVFQTYTNQSHVPIEAKYVFPLDDKAAVCGFEAFINGKHIVGEIKEKEEAQREYREAVSQGHGAYLMDQDAPVWLDSQNIYGKGFEISTDCKAVISTLEGSSLDSSGFSLHISLSAAYLPRMWVEKHPEKESEACMLVFQPNLDATLPDLADKNEVIICLDCSNSMEGVTFMQAKQIALYALSLVGEKQKVNIIQFGTGYKELFSYPKYIMSTDVSTEFIMVSKRNFLNVISSTANRHVLRTLSQCGAGVFEYFNSKSKHSWKKQVKDQMTRICSPGCHSVSVKWQQLSTNAPKALQAPAQVPSLFHNDRLLVYGFIPHCTQATLYALIQEKEFCTMVSTTELQKTTGTMIHKLAARAVIRDYEDGILHENETSHEMKKQILKSLIIKLSKENSLITQYTSFVAVEKRDGNDSPFPNIPNIPELIAKEDVDFLPYVSWQEEQPEANMPQPFSASSEWNEEPSHKRLAKKKKIKMPKLEVSEDFEVESLGKPLMNSLLRAGFEISSMKAIPQSLSVSTFASGSLPFQAADRTCSASLSTPSIPPQSSCLFGSLASPKQFGLQLGQGNKISFESGSLPRFPLQDPPLSGSRRFLRSQKFCLDKPHEDNMSFLSDISPRLESSLQQISSPPTLLSSFHLTEGFGIHPPCPPSFHQFQNSLVPQDINYRLTTDTPVLASSPSNASELEVFEDFQILASSGLQEVAQSLGLASSDYLEAHFLTPSSCENFFETLDDEIPVPLQCRFLKKEEKSDVTSDFCSSFHSQEDEDDVDGKQSWQNFVPWAELFSLQTEDGFWKLTSELGLILNLNTNVLHEFLEQKGIRSLGIKGREYLLDLIATLLVLQFLRTRLEQEGIVFKSLMKLDDPSISRNIPWDFEKIRKASEWVRRMEGQYSSICQRLELGKDWDSATKQLLGIQLPTTTSFNTVLYYSQG